MRPFTVEYVLVCCFFLSACTITENIPDDNHSSGGDLFTRPVPIVNWKNEDEYFFNYRLDQFAPDTEPFIKETFGNAPMFDEAAFWEHNAYTSCAVGFMTKLPAISIIEYGETAAYGNVTTQSESYYYLHLHYIKGLESGKTYHYRFVAQDHDGATISSGDHTFTTKKLTAGIIRIPEDMEGDAPYTLTQAGAKYVLTRDLTVPTLAINIKANDIELDLDGHTIVYDDGAQKVTGAAWNDYAYNEEATFGIRTGLWNYLNARILNGTIKQGRNGGKGFVGVGFNPLFLNHMGEGSYNEVAGVTVDYYGDNIGGMATGNGHIHHNVLYDRGTGIDDRHAAIRALHAGKRTDNDISFNSLRRFRHCGIQSNGKTSYNELYSDSFATNSFVLSPDGDEGSEITGNKIFGMGYLPIGTGWGSNTNVRNNFIYMRGYSPTKRSEEYGRKSSIAGMRITSYECKNMLFEDNVIVLKAEDECTLARGIWTFNSANNKNIVYRRNTVKVEAMPGNLKNPDRGALFPGDNPKAYYQGDPNGDSFGEVNYAISAVTFSERAENNPGNDPDRYPRAEPIIFEDNRLIGNVNLVTIGEGYGICNSVWMYRTKLEKIDHDSEFFRPVRLGFWYWDTDNNRMIDNECTGIEEIEMTPYFFGGTGKMEIRYGKSKTLAFKEQNNSPLAGKQITLTMTPQDGHTQILQTNSNGTASFDLLTVRHYKYGNSQEHNGVAGTPSQTDYLRYTFSATGYKPLSLSLAQLENSNTLTLDKQ
ncbi:MAG: hypothetical protein LBF62_05680 [Tannerellaceae bacterium]|jgi:hypothetical protein|nr:hypothetical protein [Tannerellaceae bacterium]